MTRIWTKCVISFHTIEYSQHNTAVAKTWTSGAIQLTQHRRECKVCFPVHSTHSIAIMNQNTELTPLASVLRTYMTTFHLMYELIMHQVVYMVQLYTLLHLAKQCMLESLLCLYSKYNKYVRTYVCLYLFPLFSQSSFNNSCHICFWVL